MIYNQCMQVVCSLKKKSWKLMGVWRGGVSTSNADSLLDLYSIIPWFGANTVHTQFYDDAIGREVKLVYREDRGILYLGDPSARARRRKGASPAVPVARFRRTEMGMINCNKFKWRYNVEIAAGMDVAFVAALLVFVHDLKLRAVTYTGEH